MKNTFRVYLPRWYYKLMFICSLILSMVPTIFCIVDGIDIACIIAFAIFIVPILMASLWSYRFRITVREDTITVKPGFRKKYSFNVSEITKVIRKVVLNSGIGTNVKITVYTESKHVSVESLMIGIDKFDRYIKEKVDPEKISTKVMGENVNK